MCIVHVIRNFFFYLKILAIWHNLWKQLNSEIEIIIFRHKLAGPPWTMAMHSSWTQGWFCLCGSERKLAVRRESRLEIVSIILMKNIIGIKIKRLWYSSFTRSCRIMLNFFQALEHARQLRDERGKANIVVVEDEQEKEMTKEEFEVTLLPI